MTNPAAKEWQNTETTPPEIPAKYWVRYFYENEHGVRLPAVQYGVGFFVPGGRKNPAEWSILLPPDLAGGKCIVTHYAEILEPQCQS